MSGGSAMSGNVGVASAPPDVPCDPIAIAALVAALPELEAAVKAAADAADTANKEHRAKLEELNKLQKRIDHAFATLRGKAPVGSQWRRSQVPDAEHLQQLLYEAQELLPVDFTP